MICHMPVSFNVCFDRTDNFTILLENVHFPNSIIEWEFVFQVYNVESGNLLMMPLWIKPGIVPLSTAENYPNFVIIFDFFSGKSEAVCWSYFYCNYKIWCKLPYSDVRYFLFTERISCQTFSRWVYIYSFILHNW